MPTLLTTLEFMLTILREEFLQPPFPCFGIRIIQKTTIALMHGVCMLSFRWLDLDLNARSYSQEKCAWGKKTH